MRIGGSGTGTSIPAREVEPRRTPVSPDALRSAISRAHTAVTGQAPTTATLDVLTAQASLETASGASMYNYNFGGIKGQGPSGETARCQTHEVINGKDVTVRDGFRAYGSLDQGATDYVKLMQGRFPAAMDQAQRGNVDGFAHALKQSGYYTASEASYANGLRGLMGQSGSATGATASAIIPALPTTSSMIGGSSSGNDFVDGSQLSRVMDSIGHHRATVDDDDDT